MASEPKAAGECGPGGRASTPFDAVRAILDDAARSGRGVDAHLRGLLATAGGAGPVAAGGPGGRGRQDAARPRGARRGPRR